MKLPKSKFKQKNVIIKSGKKNKIPNDCFNCNCLKWQEIYNIKYYRCSDFNGCSG